MENIIFNLQNTECSYDGKKVVLDIKKLLIPAGNIIFFVGPSGIGKSTILETLGMMNNTILTSDVFEYKKHDMRSLWKSRNSAKLAELRNNEFSFIFQQNNLMPNFSAQENAMTAALFQGMPIAEAIKKVKDAFTVLDLPFDDRPIYKYSGGQQQRIAFARAIIPNFSVLFGDEPTGNLDINTAETLMQKLSKVVHQINATAIIVSHDMHLATKYADMIVQIQKNEIKNENGKVEVRGQIDENSIYTKDGQLWRHQAEQYTNDKLYNKLINELK